MVLVGGLIARAAAHEHHMDEIEEGNFVSEAPMVPTAHNKKAEQRTDIV